MIKSYRSLLRFYFCQQAKAKVQKKDQKNSSQDNHFGFKNISTDKKQPLVNQVFHSVANKYDLMNDLMSMGIHRWWKNYFVSQLGNLSPQNLYNQKNMEKRVEVLDVAGGTGDIAFKILENHQRKNIKVTVLDINQSMLNEGVKRAQQMNLTNEQIEFICANAQELPLKDNKFDAYTISFGLRNVPRTKKALQQAYRVLKTGGRFMCLQFSKVQNPILKQIYRQYSFHMIPQIGNFVTNDKDSYQYLVQSIQRFYSQEDLLKIMQEVGFQESQFKNLTDGIVAIHSSFKFSF